MNFWTFVTPRMLGFSVGAASQFVVDKFRGAPTRPVQVAEYVARNAGAGDLQLIEQMGLIGPGNIVVADNAGDVFDPHQYLAYVRTCGRYESEYREAMIEYTDLPDGVEISLWK